MSGISRISIEQQIAEIGVQSTPAQLNISRPRMQMKITNEAPQMEIDKKAPTFKMNRKKINSESGLKGPSELARNFRDSGRAAALRGTKTAGDEGDFIGETRRGGDRISMLSRNKALANATRKAEVNIGLMPQSSPEVVWDMGHLRINWSKHSILIDWDGEYMPQVTIDPKHSIEVFLRTEPYFRVIVENYDPNMPGRYVDEAI